MLFPYLYVSYSSFLSKDVLEYTFQPAVATILMGENCPISHCAVLPSVQPSVCYTLLYNTDVLLISKQKESPYFHVGTEDQGDIRLKEDRQTDGQNNREKPHFLAGA